MDRVPNDGHGAQISSVAAERRPGSRRILGIEFFSGGGRTSG